MHIKCLAENLVQKALVLFEILSFEVYCRSDRLPVWLSRGVVFQIRISPRIAVGYYAKKYKRCCLLRLKILNVVA
jgi:hypothetical protein